MTYSGQGQPLTTTTQLTYDQGDLATITDPLGKITTRFTDPAGRLISVTSPLGPRTCWDELDRLKYEITPQGRVDYTYAQTLAPRQRATHRRVVAIAARCDMIEAARELEAQCPGPCAVDTAGAVHSSRTYAPYKRT